MAEEPSGQGAAVAAPPLFQLHESTATVGCGPRRGALAGLQTPAFTVPTSRGFPTQLRPEVWGATLGGSTQLFQLPVGDLILRQDVVRQSPASAQGCRGFWPHLDKNLSYCSFRNPRVATSVYGGDAVCSVDTSGGRRKVGPQEVLELQRVMRMDLVAAPAEEVPLGTGGHRRVGRAVFRASEWLKEILEAKEKDETLAAFSWNVIAGIQGSGDLKLREKACVDAAALPAAGFWIGSLGYGEALQARAPVLTTVAAALPPGRPRFLPLNCGSPVEVLQAVLLGIDVVEVMYPTDIAHKGLALTFAWEMPDGEEDEAKGGGDDAVAALLAGNDPGVLLPVRQLQVRLPEYKEDFTPISEWSPVKNYSRAYLYHLHEVRELLGTMLLAQHNLHAYRELFAAIRLHIEHGTLRRFAAWFLRTQTAEPPGEPPRGAAGDGGPAAKRQKGTKL